MVDGLDMGTLSMMSLSKPSEAVNLPSTGEQITNEDSRIQRNVSQSDSADASAAHQAQQSLSLEESLDFYRRQDILIDEFVSMVSLSEQDKMIHAVIRRLLQQASSTFIHLTAAVHVFGSAASGLGEKGCDIDASILVDPTALQQQFGQAPGSETDDPAASACSRAVRAIGRGIGDPANGWLDQGIRVENVITTAKIPICVLCTSSGYTCDVSINNELPLYNTQLLRLYATADPRVRSLILAVKRWAKVMNLADAKTGNLSSYSWTLLCIYYLQVRSEGPIIPSLQRIAAEAPTDAEPAIFQCTNSGRKFDVSFAGLTEARTHAAMPPACSTTVAELLKGFFQFYDREYVWGSEVVSIRTGQRKEVNDDEYRLLGKKDRRSTNYLHIEDPFDRERNLNCVLFFECAAKLRGNFRHYGGTAAQDLETLIAMLLESGRVLAKSHSGQLAFLRRQIAHGKLNPALLPSSFPEGEEAQGLKSGEEDNGASQLWRIKREREAVKLQHLPVLNKNGFNGRLETVSEMLRTVPLRTLAMVYTQLSHAGSMKPNMLATIKKILVERTKREHPAVDKQLMDFQKKVVSFPSTSLPPSVGEEGFWKEFGAEGGKKEAAEVDAFSANFMKVFGASQAESSPPNVRDVALPPLPGAASISDLTRHSFQDDVLPPRGVYYNLKDAEEGREEWERVESW